MKRLLYIVILVFSGVSQAETVPPAKNAKFDVPGVGHVRIQHDEVGEPISQPERVEVFVTCEGTKASVRVAVFRMCIYQGHSFEVGTRVLTLKMFYGRVEPKTGDVVCDQFDMKQVELADACHGKR